MQTQRLDIPNHLLIAEIRRALESGHTATFRVRGWSMRLFLEHERDVVKVERVAPQDVCVRDVVLAEIAPQRYVLHRVVRRVGDQLTLRGDGNVVGTEQCTDRDVIGRVVAFYRKGRTEPDLVTGRKWRIYSRVWLALSPVRRYILALYRLKCKICKH